MKKIVSLLLVLVLLGSMMSAFAETAAAPALKFNNVYKFGYTGRKVQVQVTTTGKAGITKGTMLELRDQYGRVWATQEYTGKKTFSFVIPLSQEHEGGFEMSVWNGDQCLTGNISHLYVADQAKHALQKLDVEGVICITLDCAYEDRQTDDVLAVLDKYGVHVTFFMAGCFAKQFTESAAKIRDAGHEIGSHSLFHAKHTTIKTSALYTQVHEGLTTLQEYLGVTPTLYRVPYGAYNSEVKAMVRGEGMELIQWEIDSHDWDLQYNHQKIVDRVTRHAASGMIILFHLDGRSCPSNLDEALDYYINTLGLRVVTVSELIELAGYQAPLSPYIPEQAQKIAETVLPTN